MEPFFSERSGIVLDPIMAIDELFRNDTAPDKMNLVVGVFQNNEGETPILDCVKIAESHLVSSEGSKAYLPIAGEPSFVELAEALVLGAAGHEFAGRQVASIQTPGSTAGLRIAAEFIRDQSHTAKAWISVPAYSNHKPIFRAAAVGVADYRYYDAVRGTLLFDEMLTDLSSASPGDVVLLHACCHNPSGADLTVPQWEILARFLKERSLLPMVDAAYIGLASGIDQDAAGLRALACICPETIIAASFSKNFALYSERVGLLSLIGSSGVHVHASAGRAKVYARALYTSPPSHGARAIAQILADEKLRVRWLEELGGMREKLLDVRRLLADGLESHGVSTLFPSLRQNRGMFTLSQMTSADVLHLRQQHHVYVLDNGRVSFGGMRKDDIPKLCAAIAQAIAARDAAA